MAGPEHSLVAEECGFRLVLYADGPYLWLDLALSAGRWHLQLQPAPWAWLQI